MQNFIVELPFGIIEISGEDAGDFLHAHCTSDVSLVTELQSQFSAWCNPQGRVIANFFILRLRGAYLLILPEDLTARVHQGLSMYILRSRVTIADKSDLYRCIGLCGSKTIGWFENIIEKHPNPDQLVILDMPVDHGRRSLSIDMTQNNILISSIPDSGIETADTQTWNKMDIQAGLAWIDSNTSELVIPQEIYLDLLGGLSYDKGCYPGQEVIAKLHYRGQLKNRLYHGIIEPDAIQVQAGVKLYSENGARKAGTVINVLTDDESRQLILAVVNTELAENSNFNLEDGQSVQIRFVTPGSFSESEINDFKQD